VLGRGLGFAETNAFVVQARAQPWGGAAPVGQQGSVGCIDGVSLVVIVAAICLRHR
jgi:hypothetical protein